MSNTNLGGPESLTVDYEQLLAAEGMPAELPSDRVLDSHLAQRTDTARTTLREELGREPSFIEIIDSLNTTPDRAGAVANYGFRVPGEHAVKEQDRAVADSDDPSFDIAYTGLLRADVHRFLQTMGERDADIISSRFGIPDDEIKTYAELGETWGFSGPRAREIEHRVMFSLRETLANPLAHYVHEEVPAGYRGKWRALVEPVARPRSDEDSQHNYALAAENNLLQYVLDHGVDSLREKLETAEPASILALFTQGVRAKLSPNPRGLIIFNVVPVLQSHLQQRVALNAEAATNPYLHNAESVTARLVWNLGLELLNKLTQASIQNRLAFRVPKERTKQ